MDFDETFYKNRFIRLREVFDSLTEAVLGDGYYNYGVDPCACDEYTGEDLARKYGKKFAEQYVKLLRSKAQVNVMKQKIEELEAENNKLKK